MYLPDQAFGAAHPRPPPRAREPTTLLNVSGTLRRRRTTRDSRLAYIDPIRCSRSEASAAAGQKKFRTQFAAHDVFSFGERIAETACGAGVPGSRRAGQHYSR